jgi:hypothetical protein
MKVSQRAFPEIPSCLTQLTIEAICQIPDEQHLPTLSSIPPADLESNQVLSNLDIQAQHGSSPLEFYQALSAALVSVHTKLRSLVVVDFPAQSVPEGACAILAHGVASSSLLKRLNIRPPTTDNNSPGLAALAEPAPVNERLEEVFVPKLD